MHPFISVDLSMRSQMEERLRRAEHARLVNDARRAQEDALAQTGDGGEGITGRARSGGILAARTGDTGVEGSRDASGGDRRDPRSR